MNVKNRNNIKINSVDIVISISMLVFAVLLVYPFWNIAIESFSPVSDMRMLSFRLFPSYLVTDAYSVVFKNRLILNTYLNTIIRTVAGTSLSLPFIIGIAYALSKKNLPFRNVITFIIMLTMFFSGGIIPTYILIRNLHMIDTLWSLILPGMLSAIHILIMRSFLMTLGNELEESAFIDGAGYFKVLMRIVIPLSKPVIATILLWNAVAHWNSWFDALLYINDNKKTVLQIVLRQILTKFSTDDLLTLLDVSNRGEVVASLESIRAATLVITILPILAIYPFAQKYFIKGVMLGSVKG
jgi:putative aldouronate transport system permease protein